MKRIRPTMLCLFMLCSFLQIGFTQKDSTTLKLNQLIETLIAQDNFNGAVLYAKGEEILYEKYHGLIHPFKEARLNQNSSFNLASISKQFFGAALLLLQEEGKIAVYAPLQNSFKDFPHKGVTVRNLVTHTSGLKEYFNEVILSYSTNHIVENEDVYRTMMLQDSLFNFEPGEQFQYSNTNYIFLGILIEQVAKMPVEQFLKERIFNKLGLKNTFAYH